MRACEVVTTCWVHADRPGCVHNKSRAGGEGPRRPTGFLFRNGGAKRLDNNNAAGSNQGGNKKMHFRLWKRGLCLTHLIHQELFVPTWSHTQGQVLGTESLDFLMTLQDSQFILILISSFNSAWLSVTVMWNP